MPIPMPRCRGGRGPAPALRSDAPTHGRSSQRPHSESARGSFRHKPQPSPVAAHNHSRPQAPFCRPSTWTMKWEVPRRHPSCSCSSWPASHRQSELENGVCLTPDCAWPHQRSHPVFERTPPIFERIHVTDVICWMTSNSRHCRFTFRAGGCGCGVLSAEKEMCRSGSGSYDPRSHSSHPRLGAWRAEGGGF